MKSREYIDKYYPSGVSDEADALRALLLHHSAQVAARAVKIVDAHPELGADRAFVEEAAWIHDIGIFLTDAPGIHCHGAEPYLIHGYLGAQLMRREGEPKLARVCERHTGTGLTAENVRIDNLPLPPADYRPETIEEQIVCYADKFYSKSHPKRERTVEQTAKSLQRFGEAGVGIFLAWAQMFE